MTLKAQNLVNDFSFDHENIEEILKAAGKKNDGRVIGNRIC